MLLQLKFCITILVNQRSIHRHKKRTDNVLAITKTYKDQVTDNVSTQMEIYLRFVANPSATEAFKEGETGASPRNTSKRAEATVPDSIVASTPEGISPSEETQT